MTIHVKPATGAEQALAAQYRGSRERRGDDALGAFRDAAFSAFAAAGLPGRRIESWHYTDLRGLLRESFEPASAPDVATIDLARRGLDELPPAGLRLVLVDGFFVPELSGSQGHDGRLTVVPAIEALAAGGSDPNLVAAEALGAPESVVALNAALFDGGVAITVAPGAKIDPPIELVSFISGVRPAAINARSYVHLGAHASATLVERHVALADTPSQNNHVLVFAVEDGAAIEHVTLLDRLGAGALHLGTTLARLGADARLTGLTLTATEGVTRRQTYLEFVGAASEADFRGVSLLGGRCHADTTLLVTHTAPGCTSRELFKHILDGEATGVFQGKVIVAPGAQKTDGKMLSKAIILEEGASMFNKPELEIFADDVVCGHGATAGALDDDQLFYLRARGIPLAGARAMLLEAFAADVIQGLSSEALAAELAGRVSRWLHDHGG